MECGTKTLFMWQNKFLQRKYIPGLQMKADLWFFPAGPGTKEVKAGISQIQGFPDNLVKLSLPGKVKQELAMHLRSWALV